MKVFAAWSGNSSKRIAQIFRKWLPQVLPFVDVWMSEEDIAKGTRWSVELWNNLREADFGILCLVPGNVAAHWTIFEAGALSGGRADDRVSPFLLGIQPSDLPVPLRQFQCTSFQNKDVLSLVSRLNTLANDKRLSEQVLEKSFQTHWPRLRDRLKKIDLTQSEKEETEDASKDADQSVAKQVQLDDVHLKILKTLGSSRSPLGWELRTSLERVLSMPRPLLFVKLKDLVIMAFVNEGRTQRGRLFYRASEQGVKYLYAKGLISG